MNVRRSRAKFGAVDIALRSVHSLASMIRPTVLLWILFGLPQTAFAIAHVESKGRVNVGQTEVALVQDGTNTTLTARLELDTKATEATLLFALGAGVDVTSIRLLDDGAPLNALQRTTEPRFVTLTPPDPCDNNAIERRDRQFAWPEARPSLSSQYDIKYIPPNQVAAVTENAPPSVRRAIRRARGGLIRVRLSGLKSQRGRWTRPVQWRTSGFKSLMPFLAANLTPTGREHRLTLYTVNAELVLAPEVATERHPKTATLPEIAIETPRDTTRTIVRHLIRKKGGDPWIVTYSASADALPAGLGAARGVLTRWTAIVSAKRNNPVSFVTKALLSPLTPELIIRRVWRKPLGCVAPKFVNNVRIQQMSELRAYAGMTGRKIADVLAQSQSRGYAQKKDGSLGAVTPEYPGGAIE